ncbi:MAG TPA: efflux RND transporter permease subunit, partial [Polyangiaceae bacterium]|nr:efflux RND transporter permease subunit [Polyangiaceae bacterium]
IVSRLGREFLPRFDEGDLLFMPTARAGLTLGEAAEQLGRQDRAIKRFAEVRSVFGKVGRATSATDLAPVSMAETTIRLRPRSEWPTEPRPRWYSSWAPAWLEPLFEPLWPARTPCTTAELVERLDRATTLPGWTSAWTTPARARMDMLATGVHTPIGIRVIARDPARLQALGTELEALARRVPGTKSAVFEALRGEAWPRFEPDTSALVRHHVDEKLALETADLVLSGGTLGDLEWQGEPYRLRVTQNLHHAMGTRSIDHLRDVTVRSSAEPSQPVPLALLGRASFVMEPALVRSERGELAAYVYVELTPGLDPATYVARAKKEVERERATGALALKPDERLEWTGQYELLAQGERRLRAIVPLVLGSMLLLLFWQFKSLTEAAIVLLSVPFALVGSVWTLHWSGYALSAPVWVGLLSTAGLAMQMGVVMVVYIDAAFHRRLREGRIRTRDDIVEAHAEGTVLRLRPKLMTMATMAAGLLPLVWLDGAGAEILRRVAAPMLGGLATSAFLTLEVIPVIYTLWRHRQLETAERLGQPLATVVGRVPSWATD